MAAPKRLRLPLGRWGDRRRISIAQSPAIAACWRRRLRRCARTRGTAFESGSRDCRSTPRRPFSAPAHGGADKQRARRRTIRTREGFVFSWSCAAHGDTDKQGAQRERRPRRNAFAETPWLRFDETAPSPRRGCLRGDPFARRRRRTQGDALPLRRVTAGTDFATDEFAPRRARQSRRARRARCRRPPPHEAGNVPRLCARTGPGSPGGREGGSDSKLAKSAAKMGHAATLTNVASNGPTGLFRTRRSRPGRRPGWRAFEASSGLFVPLTHGPGQYARRPGTRAESVPLGTRAGSAWNLAGSASPRLGPTVPAVT